jgi:ferredoxin-NADP reductase
VRPVEDRLEPAHIGDRALVARAVETLREIQAAGPLIESLIPDREADYFFYEPKPFMVNIYHQLLEWGVPAGQVHLEFSGPRQGLGKVAQLVCIGIRLRAAQEVASHICKTVPYSNK